MLEVVGEKKSIEELCCNKFFRFPEKCVGIFLTRSEWESIPQEIKEDCGNLRKYILDYPVVIEEDCDEEVLRDLRVRIRLNSVFRALISTELYSKKCDIEDELKDVEEAIEYIESLEAVF
jgi:hypothetical protein